MKITDTIKRDEPLAKHTTLKVGGAAEYFVEIETIEDLKEAVTWARENDHVITVLGGGSNVLIPDEGLHGLVIKNGISTLEVEDKGTGAFLVVAGAGMVFDELVAETVRRGWWGLENLSAIPGSVGGVPIQNVGAYGTEAQDCVEWVEVLDVKTNETQKLSHVECQFSYRHSFFKTEEAKNFIITRVACTLSKEPNPNLSYKDLSVWFQGNKEPTQEQIRAAVMRIRSQKFPDWKQVGTAGSFFKNIIVDEKDFKKIQKEYPDVPNYPMQDGRIKIPLGWILDHVLQLKGHGEGNVSLFAQQALVLVHNGEATAKEIETFAKNIQQKVFDVIGVNVDWEVTKL